MSAHETCIGANAALAAWGKGGDGIYVDLRM
jgi:hypothetical protein